MLTLDKHNYLGADSYRFETGGLVISETEYHHKVFEGWHCHENHHITLVVRGGNLEQRKSGEQEARPGMAIWYNSGELHRNLHTQHPSRNINLSITAPFLSQYALDMGILKHTPGVGATLLKMYQESRINDACTATAMEALLLHLFSRASLPDKGGHQPPWIAELRMLLNDRWDETLSLQQLADILYVHPVTISKYFPRYFSCTLGTYMRLIRIERALPLIRRPDMSLSAVAYTCGFADQSHFIKAFKSITGMLPRTWQQL